MEKYLSKSYEILYEDTKKKNNVRIVLSRRTRLGLPTKQK